MEDVTVYSMDDDPWNRKRQQTPPGLDEIFNDIFGGKKSGSGGSKGISFTPLIMALLVLFIASGFFIVGPAEKAVIVRLGKVHRVAGPGPNWVFPIAESRTIVDTQKISSINYNAEMLTSDESYADVDVTVFFRVAEPVDYLYNAVNPVDALAQATASSLRQVLGNTELDPIMTYGRAEARDQIHAQIEKVADFYRLGIEVTDTKLQDAKPPAAVKPSFDDVIRAREDFDRYIMDAEAYRNAVVPKAQGESARILNEANAKYEQVVNNAHGQVAPFLAILKEYKRNPEVIRNELFISTMRDVYGRSNKVFMSNDSNLNLLPLSDLLSQRGRSNDE
tara:strand:- start:118 stop:1122 length:1005 start_codon:yes stop_codon:yes gene_type:complete